MKFRARRIWITCLFVVLAIRTLADASGQEPNVSLELLKPDVHRLLHLSAEQVSKLNELAAEFGPRIAAGERAARETPTQHKARQEAIQKAIAAGKRGAEVRRLVTAAVCMTKEQEVAAQEVLRLHNALDRSAFAILTEQQREKIESGQVPLFNEYTGFIIVRLAPGVSFEFDDSQRLDEVARKLKLDGLSRVLDAHDLKKSYRVMRGISEKEFSKRIRSTTTRDLFRRLESYWRIDARQQTDQIKSIISQLNELPEIDTAYRELAVGDATPGSTDNPFHEKQGYLDPAPTGIDARVAWTQPNGRGAGIGMVDVEQSWNRFHEDLVGQSPLLVFGDVNPGDHGTAVLGTVVATDNTVGVIGIAPSIDYVFLSSYFRTAGPDESCAAAIVHPLLLMYPGDVLLLELQTDPAQFPIEIQDMEYDAIQLAVSLGIIVVEAAGNGHHNLDEYTDAVGKQILKRGSPDFRDSGAILVGASDPRDRHNRTNFSNFGSRIDCFAWGRYVATSGTIRGVGDLSSGGGDPNKTYTALFHGTSSSAPIVAGAAIILQGMAKSNSGTLISPHQMRDFLADRATGTLQGPDVPGNIGVMPDLNAIIQANSVFRCMPQPRRCFRGRVGPFGFVKRGLKVRCGFSR